MIDDLCTCEGNDRLGESAIPDIALHTPCLLTGTVIAVRRILEANCLVRDAFRLNPQSHEPMS